MMKLSCSSVHEVSSGSILNLLSSDVAKFDTFFMSFHYVWIIPLQAIAMACLIWQRIGIATLVGIGSMIITTIPIQCNFSSINRIAKSKSYKYLYIVTKIEFFHHFLSSLRQNNPGYANESSLSDRQEDTRDKRVDQRH